MKDTVEEWPRLEEKDIAEKQTDLLLRLPQLLLFLCQGPAGQLVYASCFTGTKKKIVAEEKITSGWGNRRIPSFYMRKGNKKKKLKINSEIKKWLPQFKNFFLNFWRVAQHTNLDLPFFEKKRKATSHPDLLFKQINFLPSKNPCHFSPQYFYFFLISLPTNLHWFLMEWSFWWSYLLGMPIKTIKTNLYI